MGVEPTPNNPAYMPKVYRAAIRQQVVKLGADDAARQFDEGATVYEVPTHDRYLADSIAVMLRNRGYAARSDRHFVRLGASAQD